MLSLIIRLDGEAYALDASRIVEILPLVNAAKAAGAADGLASAISYRGAIVPVLDLAVLTLGRASQPCLSTRIVLVRGESSTELVGLIAENATEIQRIEPGDFASGSLTDRGPGHLGPIAMTPDGPIQRIELDHLLASHGARAAQRAA